jgi:hypothetical protein
MSTTTQATAPTKGVATFVLENTKAIGNTLRALIKKISIVAFHTLQFLGHYALIGLKLLMKGALALVDQLKTISIFLAQHAAEIALKIFQVVKDIIVTYPSQVGCFFGGAFVATMTAIIIARMVKRHVEAVAS